MTKCVKPLYSDLVSLSAKSSRSTNRIVHLDDLALKVTKSVSGLTHFVIHRSSHHFQLDLTHNLITQRCLH
jgi:hypothetical protein